MIPTRATNVPAGPDWLHEIRHDGYRLIALREGSHATPSASTTTSLSGHFGFSVYATGTRRVTESCRIALLGAPGLHLTQRSVAGDARVMFLGDLMLQTR